MGQGEEEYIALQEKLELVVLNCRSSCSFSPFCFEKYREEKSKFVLRLKRENAFCYHVGMQEEVWVAITVSTAEIYTYKWWKCI